MPTQSIASEKDTEALTSRKLQLSDLVKQLSHYNENVRKGTYSFAIILQKDALNGLRELVVSHPTVLHVHLGYICEHTCERILDGANVVRQALIQLFKQIFTSVNKVNKEGAERHDRTSKKKSALSWILTCSVDIRGIFFTPFFGLCICCPVSSSYFCVSRWNCFIKFNYATFWIVTGRT